jgi:hypothetical protein
LNTLWPQAFLVVESFAPFKVGFTQMPNSNYFNPDSGTMDDMPREELPHQGPDMKTVIDWVVKILTLAGGLVASLFALRLENAISQQEIKFEHRLSEFYDKIDNRYAPNKDLVRLEERMKELEAEGKKVPNWMLKNPRQGQ